MNRTTAAIIGILLLAALSSGSTAEVRPATLDVPIKSFEFLGCSGDWNEDTFAADIWRIGSSTGTTYLIRHPGTCGANAARNPKATLAGGVLDLGYEAFSTTDLYASCMCEFWAKYTLSNDVSHVTSATFNTESARLKGTWPER